MCEAVLFEKIGYPDFGFTADGEIIPTLHSEKFDIQEDLSDGEKPKKIYYDGPFNSTCTSKPPKSTSF